MQAVTSVEELKKASWRLQLAHDQSESSLKQLISTKYHVFIENTECMHSIHRDMKSLQSQVDQMAVEIEHTQNNRLLMGQNEIEKSVKQFNDLFHVLTHFHELQSLLELGQALRDCIQQEMYEKAIQLIQFGSEIIISSTNKPRQSAGEKNVVLCKLRKEIQEATICLRQRLLDKLCEDVSLSNCVQIVSLLRRVNAFIDNSVIEKSEQMLEKDFIACRNRWLTSQLNTIRRENLSHYILQVIDSNRIHWTDLITQYSAIFGVKSVDNAIDMTLCQWAVDHVSEFIALLDRYLPDIHDLSSVSSIIEQSLFFSGSFGRLGIDFRGTLIVFFEEHVLERNIAAYMTATAQFRQQLFEHAIKSNAKKSVEIALPSLHTTESKGFTYTSGSDLSPPRQLLSYPILVQLTNSILSSLNDLRLCTIASLRARLHQGFYEMLLNVTETIAEFSEAAELTRSNSACDPDLLRQFMYMTKAIRDYVIPYLLCCFQRLYPDTKPQQKPVTVTRAPSECYQTLNTILSTLAIPSNSS